MGWSFRKSIKFGPMRVNFSKSGIGVSAGVKGARISAGPRGTYLNVGRGGVSYRQKLDGTGKGANRGTNYQSGAATQVPSAAIEQIPAYPQFPKHGLPRIVKTSLIIASVMCVVGLWIGVMSSSQNTQQPTKETIKQTATIQANANNAPTTSAERLAAARRYAPAFATIDQVNESSLHLKGIPRTAPEYKEAQTLLRQFQKRSVELTKAASRSTTVSPAPAPPARQAMTPESSSVRDVTPSSTRLSGAGNGYIRGPRGGVLLLQWIGT
jgi:hypothetical protein